MAEISGQQILQRSPYRHKILVEKDNNYRANSSHNEIEGILALQIEFFRRFR